MRWKNAIRRRGRHVIRWFLLAGWFPARRWSWGPRATGGEALVIMALWNRPSRLIPVLEMLDGQDHPHGVRLFLWNNNRADHGGYVADLAGWSSPGGALRSVALVKSPHNLGSIGRWFWARRLSRPFAHHPVIVIDDDQDFGTDFIARATAAYEPGVVKAWWSWVIRTTYHDRVRAVVGDRVDHVGPGGSVLPIDLFRDRRFFTDIPDQFRMLDDLWLTWFARERGYTLGVLDVEIEFVMEETNQYHGQIDLKTMFYDHLYRG